MVWVRTTPPFFVFEKRIRSVSCNWSIFNYPKNQLGGSNGGVNEPLATFEFFFWILRVPKHGVVNWGPLDVGVLRIHTWNPKQPV